MKIIDDIFDKMNGDNPRAVYELFPFELTCLVVGFAMSVGSLAVTIGALLFGIFCGMWEIVQYIAGILA